MDIKKINTKAVFLNFIGFTLIFLTGSHHACFSQDTGNQVTQYKLSTGYYNMAAPMMASKFGQDINLRANSDIGNAWVGIYQTNDQTFNQTRIGWDRPLT